VGFESGGITARQVINLAEHNQLNYKTERGSDITKARNEINKATPVSALKDEVRFLTNAGEDSKVTYHHVVIKFREYAEAVAKLSVTPTGEEEKALAGIVNALRKGKLAFDCDCERHRYFLRYVASIGGWNAGRDETGFPKIRNPGLKGVACKHVLRVMAEIESSGVFARFLSRHLLKMTRANQAKTRTKATKEEMAKSHSKKGVRIRPDSKEKLERQAKKAKQNKTEITKAVRAPKPPRTGRSAPASRRTVASIEAELARLEKKKGAPLTMAEVIEATLAIATPS
jgi:hypothetical protein